MFFDNDGLLVNTEPLYLQAVQDVLGPLGIEITREWYIRENLGKGTSTFLLAEQTGLPEERIKELRLARNERYTELLKNGVQPLDGVPEVLELLHGNFLMGVVTSSRKDHFNTIMELTGLRKFFSFFITGNDVQNTKPHPEPYLTALEHSGFEKEQCLVLEDAYRGVQAAKAAGLTCYAIPDELTRAHNFSSADKVLTSIRELPDLILPVKSEVS
ncbi:HAD family phosphatase [Candidatus Parcubacteria bacterium]|nr:MAG: HAD family phosphatase [Candidatus Parcubacteria bacterium]